LSLLKQVDHARVALKVGDVSFIDIDG
jgi:hypothetical protein